MSSVWQGKRCAFRERNREVDEAHHERARGQEDPREVDFRDQVGVLDHAVARVAERAREELPRQDRSAHEYGVGRAVRR